MCVLITIALVGLFLIIAAFLTRLDARQEEKRRQLDFERRMNGCIEHVKRYTSKFNASLEHIKKIRDVFSELVNSDTASNMKPYEVFVIPKDHMHFPEAFFVVADENKLCKLIITEESLSYDEETIKKYLPFGFTVEEFSEFVRECEEENQITQSEYRRRNKVTDVLNKVKRKDYFIEKSETMLKN